MFRVPESSLNLYNILIKLDFAVSSLANAEDFAELSSFRTDDVFIKIDFVLSIRIE